jgi:NAD(P)H-quinone oxidoreductase subunit 5
VFEQLTVQQWLLLGAVAAPGLVFLALSMLWLAGWNGSERVLASVTAATYTLLTADVAALAWSSGVVVTSVSLGDWFVVHGYHFPLLLFADWLSIPLMGMTAILCGLIGAFSRRYLHRDRGFHRFYLLLHLFGFGSILVFAAGSFDMVVAGWELTGITSVLLIAFFYERPDPVRNALRAFAVYRACDLGLLWVVVVFHHAAGSTSYQVLLSREWAPGTLTLSGLLLLLAAAGKSAQVPFSGWLPRAMEGPTPSSAIFYGAISVHAGAYLLLRAQPLIAASPFAAAAVCLIGVLSAFHGTMVGRASADAKTSLAYASMAQLGIIFVEIGLGYPRLALFHILGHAFTRTLQFLRAPSMLHDFHHVHAAAGGHLDKTGTHFESMLPVALRTWLYRLALDRGRHDAVLERFVIAPLEAVSRLLRWPDRFVLDPPGPGGVPSRRNEAVRGIDG